MEFGSLAECAEPADSLSPSAFNTESSRSESQYTRSERRSLINSSTRSSSVFAMARRYSSSKMKSRGIASSWLAIPLSGFANCSVRAALCFVNCFTESDVSSSFRWAMPAGNYGYSRRGVGRILRIHTSTASRPELVIS